MKYLIANWKMKLSCEEEIDMVKRIASHSFDDRYTTLSLCPSFLSLHESAKLLKETRIHLGAQDCFFEDTGAYTGEISPEFLEDMGCEYVILGHSERRKHL